MGIAETKNTMFVVAPTSAVSIILFLLLAMLPSEIVAQPATKNETATSNATALVDVERQRCGEIIDMHIHPSNYSSVDPIIRQMDAAGISRAVLYAVYAANNTFLPDANTQVERMVVDSEQRMYGLASLDTSGDWNATRDAEIARLLEHLEKPEFVGTKLAPPHTCLEMNGAILPDVVRAVSLSSKPVVALHTGTTPFCSEFGELILGYRACCQEQFVDPTYLEPLVAQYPNVTFILLHTGLDFLPPTDQYFYNGTVVEHTIELAAAYQNVWLEISGLAPFDPSGRPRNPTGDAVVASIKEKGLADRVFYGSDANFPGFVSIALEWAVTAMIDAGFSEEERCSALVQASLDVFGISPLTNTTMPPSTSVSSLFRHQWTFSSVVCLAVFATLILW